MIHRGEIIEKAVRQSGMSIAEVARRLGKSRRHVYNLFEDPNISLDVILQISKIIHYDFTGEFPELKNKHTTQMVNDMDATYEKYKDTVDWKDKYLQLLEKYNALLEKLKN